MIETDVLNTMLQTGIFAITVPVVLIVAWKMRNRKSLVPFFVGICIFLLFAKGLEMIPHTLFVLTDNPVSRVVTGNVLLYALYGGLAAGLFEEIGRYVAFRFLVRKYPEKETAVTYGIGHGGIECILVLGLGYLQYYTYGQLINNGTLQKMMESAGGNDQMTASFQTLVDTVTSIQKSTCWFAGWERISALMLQIALSILVFQAVKEAGKKHMLWVAVLLHAAADIPAGFYQKGAIPLLTAEIMIFVFAVLVFLYAIRAYRDMETQKVDPVQEERKHSLHQMANQRFKDHTTEK